MREYAIIRNMLEKQAHDHQSSIGLFVHKRNDLHKVVELYRPMMIRGERTSAIREGAGIPAAQKVE